jgi:DNA polymerase III alpha subunit (gram-positive type)
MFCLETLVKKSMEVLKSFTILEKVGKGLNLEHEISLNFKESML